MSLLLFVLPVTIGFTAKPIWSLDTAWLRNLRVCLVDLRENRASTLQPHDTKAADRGINAVSADRPQICQAAATWAAVMGYEYTSVYYDHFSQYPVQDEKACAARDEAIERKT